MEVGARVRVPAIVDDGQVVSRIREHSRGALFDSRCVYFKIKIECIFMCACARAHIKMRARACVCGK